MLETKESEIRSDFGAKRSSLETEVSDLENKIATGSDSETLSFGLDDSVNESLEKLNSAKKVKHLNFHRFYFLYVYKYLLKILVYFGHRNLQLN